MLEPQMKSTSAVARQEGVKSHWLIANFSHLAVRDDRGSYWFDARACAEIHAAVLAMRAREEVYVVSLNDLAAIRGEHPKTTAKTCRADGVLVKGSLRFSQEYADATAAKPQFRKDNHVVSTSEAATRLRCKPRAVSLLLPGKARRIGRTNFYRKIDVAEVAKGRLLDVWVNSDLVGKLLELSPLQLFYLRMGSRYDRRVVGNYGARFRSDLRDEYLFPRVDKWTKKQGPMWRAGTIAWWCLLFWERPEGFLQITSIDELRALRDPEMATPELKRAFANYLRLREEEEFEGSAHRVWDSTKQAVDLHREFLPEGEEL